MPIKAMLVEKTSKKGNKYVCIELTIAENVKKIVLLEKAELELIKLTANNK